MPKARSSNFELLRIIAMFGIVVHHFINFCVVDFDVLNLNAVISGIFILGGKIGVDIFVLISGYFMVMSTEFKFSKPIKLWLQVFMYSVSIFAVVCLRNPDFFTAPRLVKELFPIGFNRWWFASTYFVMLLFSPFLNALLRSINQKQHIILMTLCVVLWSFLGVLNLYKFQLSNLLLFFMLYTIAAYIRLYKNDVRVNKKIAACIALITLCVDAFMQVALSVFGKEIPLLKSYVIPLRLESSPFTLIISVCLLLIFKDINIKNSRVINTISSATFGVYLIHDNKYMRAFMWESKLDGDAIKSSPYFLFYMLGICALIYIACTLIELARIYILEKHYSKLLRKAEPRLKELFEKLMMPIYKILQ